MTPGHPVTMTIESATAQHEDPPGKLELSCMISPLTHLTRNTLTVRLGNTCFSKYRARKMEDSHTTPPLCSNSPRSCLHALAAWKHDNTRWKTHHKAFDPVPFLHGMKKFFLNTTSWVTIPGSKPHIILLHGDGTSTHTKTDGRLARLSGRHCQYLTGMPPRFWCVTRLPIAYFTCRCDTLGVT